MRNRDFFTGTETMRAPLRLALLASTLALPAAAQEAGGGSPAIAILVRQAERWLAQDRVDLAAAPIERALAAEPNNPQALAVAARIEVARGNREGANAFLARLGQGGNRAQVQEVQDAIRASGVDRQGLEEARRLASEGRAAAAVQRYRALFGNQAPPDAYALEYAQALSGAPATRQEGIEALSRQATRPNATSRARLAYAQALTFDPPTRLQGIQQLQALAGQADVGGEARRAWAAAIGFSGNDPAMLPAAEAFLQRYPDDTEMRRRVETLRASIRTAPAADPEAAGRQLAFQRLEAGDIGDSARRFQELLARDPNDSDSLGGLGIIRLREGNLAEARDLLGRAMANDPQGGRQWQRAFEGAAYGDELATARALLRRNDLEAAEVTARRAAIREVDDRSDIETLLGDIALRVATRGGGSPLPAALSAARFPPPRPGWPRPCGPRPRPRTRVASERAWLPSRRKARASAGMRQARPSRLRRRLPGRSRARGRSGRRHGASAQALAAAPDSPWIRLDLARALRPRAGARRVARWWRNWPPAPRPRTTSTPPPCWRRRMAGRLMPMRCWPASRRAAARPTWRALAPASARSGRWWRRRR